MSLHGLVSSLALPLLEAAPQPRSTVTPSNPTEILTHLSPEGHPLYPLEAPPLPKTHSRCAPRLTPCPAKEDIPEEAAVASAAVLVCM